MYHLITYHFTQSSCHVIMSHRKQATLSFDIPPISHFSCLTSSIMNLPPYSPLLARIIVHNIIIPIIYLALGYLLAGHLFSFTSSTSWIIYHFLSWVLAYCVQIVVEFHQRLLQLHITVETPKDSCSQHGLSIPIIPSEYPFNIDILFQWMNEGKTEYFGKGMIQRLSGRFGQINGRRIKTFNTKIFGENSVCPSRSW